MEKGPDYTESLGKIPYVFKDEVYLFKGDEFGVNLTFRGVQEAEVAYQKDPAKADLVFHFTQEVKEGEKPMMLLKITNQCKNPVFMEALMTVPGEKDIYDTTILPIDPGMSSYESWTHPIVQLVLRNFRAREK